LFSPGRWSAKAAFALLILIVPVGCENEGERVVTRVVTETVAVEGEPVEVTRIVTETEIREVTPVAAGGAATGKDLIICLAQEPVTLYLYGEESTARTHILHGLYDSLYLTRSFAYQPHGLARLPSLENGDAVIEDVQVETGARVVNANGHLVSLEPGTWLRNAEGNSFQYEGGAVTLPQMAVDFELNPMVWEDGTPVTASDSVFSFEIASHVDTMAPRFLIERTASYEATGERTMRWTGVPGWLDPTYFLNAWTPLPRHAWENIAAADLLEADSSNRRPLSYGPFRLQEWVPGEQIRLVRNEHYWREGFPKLDSVTFKFMPDSNQVVANLLAGQCDVAPENAMDVSQVSFLIEAQSQELLAPHFQTGTVFEHIDFGINPVAEYASERPDWFEDVRVRQAMAMCTDRQRMVDTILYGRSEVVHSYVPASHPLYPGESLTIWPYDPQTGNDLLDEVGFVDDDEDGIREYHAAGGVAGADGRWNGTPFIVTMGLTAGNGMRQQLAEIFRENMAQCGITVEPYSLPSRQWFEDGPEGLLFGRQYDLGQFGWLTDVEPPCYYYAGWNIPGPPEAMSAEGEPLHPAGWRGQNQTGWSNAEFDAACKQGLDALYGSDAYEQNHREAQLIFARQLPVIPLFLRLKVAVTRPEVVNFSVDPSQESELFNLYEIDLSSRP
jgi:peptide/nickel transport system substrate-binding protein